MRFLFLGDYLTEIFTFENLYNAYLYTRKGKRDKKEVQKYEYHALENTLNLTRELQSKTYRLGEYNEFYVYEPKKRLIKASPFRDRVVQRCLCEQVLEPAIEKNLIYDTYACRKGKGTHAGLDRTEEFMKSYFRKYGIDSWIIKGDISSYFYSISHEILMENLYPLIDGYDVWWLIEEILNSEESGVGLPLGNQSSQWFANFYLSKFDHYCKEVLGLKYYVRYMDDWFTIIKTKEQAKEILEEMKNFLMVELGLKTNNKTQIFPLKNGMDFLGFHLYITDTGKVIRKVRRESKEKMRQKLKTFETLYELGLIDKDEIDRSYESWKGHVKHGSCYLLIESMDGYYNAILKGDG